MLPPAKLARFIVKTVNRMPHRLDTLGHRRESPGYDFPEVVGRTVRVVFGYAHYRTWRNRGGLWRSRVVPNHYVRPCNLRGMLPWP